MGARPPRDLKGTASQVATEYVRGEEIRTLQAQGLPSITVNRTLRAVLRTEVHAGALRERTGNAGDSAPETAKCLNNTLRVASSLKSGTCAGRTARSALLACMIPFWKKGRAVCQMRQETSNFRLSVSNPLSGNGFLRCGSGVQSSDRALGARPVRARGYWAC